MICRSESGLSFGSIPSIEIPDVCELIIKQVFKRKMLNPGKGDKACPMQAAEDTEDTTVVCPLQWPKSYDVVQCKIKENITKHNYDLGVHVPNIPFICVDLEERTSNNLIERKHSKNLTVIGSFESLEKHSDRRVNNIPTFHNQKAIICNEGNSTVLALSLTKDLEKSSLYLLEIEYKNSSSLLLEPKKFDEPIEDLYYENNEIYILHKDKLKIIPNYFQSVMTENT